MASKRRRIKEVKWSMLEGLVLETRSLLHLLVLTYIETYVFRDNTFQAHSLEQSCHPTQPFKQEKNKIKQNQKFKFKNNIKLI
jgi:hypothetical protein